MEKFVIVNCCECGLPFRAMGEGQFVTCPYCGTELSFKPIKKHHSHQYQEQENETWYNPEIDNPLYYDEDLEGAPGYYSGDF